MGISRISGGGRVAGGELLGTSELLTPLVKLLGEKSSETSPLVQECGVWSPGEPAKSPRLSGPSQPTPIALGLIPGQLRNRSLRLFGSFIPVDFQEGLQIFLVLFLSSLSFCLPQGEDDKNIIGRLHSSAN